jgi:hypothetical protein
LISVFSLFNWEALVIEQSFEYNGGMQLGDPTTDERVQRSPLDEALDDAEQALTTMISLLAAGNLDPLTSRRSAGGNASKSSATNCRWLIMA